MSSFSPNPSPSGSARVTLDRVAARTPDGKTLFEDLSLAFGRERTGVVGRNGTGKTTLLRLIAGLVEPDAGVVSRVGQVGWLPQSREADPRDTVADGLGVHGPLAVLSRLSAGEGHAQDLAEADWTLETRLAQAMADVGLPNLALDRPLHSLSGGQQTRVALAGVLLRQPDLLVLDEPTNHLDGEGRALIADLLARWPGGVVVASHDRALLRRMDRMVELSSLGVQTFGGGYDLFAERKADETAAAEQALDSARREMDRAGRENQAAVERKARRDKAGRAFRARASEPKILLDARAARAERTGGRETRLAERRSEAAAGALMEAEGRVERLRALDIPMPSPGLASGRMVVTLDGAAWRGSDGRLIRAPTDLRLIGPERVAITGGNGAGKTTLLRLIAGELEASVGQIARGATAAFLDQEVSLLRPDETLLEAWLRLNPDGTPNAAQAALARFLFRNTAAGRRVDTLSGGERLRAGLACVMTGTRPPQLLLLDEPTNHLDLDSVLAVQAALNAYDGALVVVSHDLDFLDAIGVARRIDLSPSP